MGTDLALPLGGGRYRLVELLGEGGMATVFVVEDTVLQVRRAIKVLKPDLIQQPDIRRRFLREARILASISHPGLITVHDAGEDEDGRMYMVMELLEGGSMADVMQRDGPCSPERVLQLAEVLLSALETVHERGIIHRDIKPSNILMTGGGMPRLADFGIARTLDTTTQVTRTGVSMGTFAYMPPEQMMDARQVNERSDIYALGATLCAFLIGQDPLGLRDSHTRAGILAGLPEPLAAVIDRATQANPAERFSSVQALRAALTDSPAPQESPTRGAGPAKLGGAVVLLALLVGAGWYSSRPPRSSVTTTSVEPAAPEPATPEPATPEPAAPEPATPEPAPEPERSAPAEPSTVVQEVEMSPVLLKVNARPWSELKVNGVDRGGTPWSAPVSPGKYTLSLIDGADRSKTLTVTVPADVEEWVVCWSHDRNDFCLR